MLTLQDLTVLRPVTDPQLYEVLQGVSSFAFCCNVEVKIVELYVKPEPWHARTLINEFPFRAVIVDGGPFNETLINYINNHYVYNPREPHEKVATRNDRGVWLQSHPYTFRGKLE